jgi:polysaccharide chain length determinant protein (PEP-CTERM system associated)
MTKRGETMPKESWMARRAAGVTQSHFPMNLPQTPSDYLEILRFRWPWVVAAVAVGAVASQVVVRFVPKQYVSQTVVLVESEKIPESFIPQLTTDAPTDRLRTIHEEILARPRIERILDELQPYPEMVDVPRADVVDMVRRRAAIGLRGNDAFVVQYADTDPERAKRLAERLASMFIEETSGARARQVQGANEFIDNQLVQTKGELEQVEGKLKVIKQRYMGMLPNQLEANLATLQRMELERQSVAEQIRVARERRSLLERQLALQSQMNEPEAQLIPELPVAEGPAAGPPGASNLPALKAYLAQLRTRYTAEHPEVVATEKRIARLEREMSDAAAAEPVPVEAESAPEPATATSTDFLVSDMTAQIAAVDRDIANLEARSDQIRSQIGVYQTRVEKIPEVEQELQSLERDYELISRYYSELLSRKLEAETAGAVEKRWQEEQFKILDPAQVPENAVFPDPKVFLLVGTLIGLGAGLAAAFLVEVADPTVKNLRELEALLPYPVLLTLPRLKEPRRSFRRRSNSPIPPSSPPSKDADAAELSAAS